MAEDRFVKFSHLCNCGTELEVHGEYFAGGRPGPGDHVECPKCGKHHPIPTRVQRFFYHDETSWKVGKLK